jgi:DNA-binding PadR family transcriptional regulator
LAALVKFPLLALLAGRPAHGYELKQAFEERFGAVWPPINIGQVYSTLGRLERDGLVSFEEVPQQGRPAKKVYEICESGELALLDWLNAPAAGTRIKDEFFMKFVLAQLTGASDPYELIERQRAEALRSLRDLADLVSENGENAGTALLIEGAALHLQADLRWLDRCEEQLVEGGGR